MRRSKLASDRALLGEQNRKAETGGREGKKYNGG